MTVRTVRDGKQILRFEGDVIASATSQRPGVPRWSELVVYRLRGGSYVVAKIGRSTVAHRPDCDLVSKHMVSWLEAGEEGRVHRVPCTECWPDVGDRMDPQTILEATRYNVLQAPDVESLRLVLADGRANPPSLIRRLLTDIGGH